MKVQAGELLIADNGHCYRVVECGEQFVSLKRVDGYTIFSCKPVFLEGAFRPANGCFA